MAWGEYRYIEALKENLKFKQEWLYRARLYMDYVKIQKDAEINFFKNRPITCAMVFLINLPMNILSFLQNLKYKYLVDKVTIQANYIRHEIRKIEENSKLTD